MINLKQVQAEIEESLLRGAEAMLEQLNKEDIALGGEHLHAFCIERANNLAMVVSEIMIDHTRDVLDQLRKGLFAEAAAPQAGTVTHKLEP